MDSKPTIIVYGDEPIGTSASSIRAQARSLAQFQPFYVGLRSGSELGLPENQFHFIGGPGPLGSMLRARFRLMGPSRATLGTLSQSRPALIQAHYGTDTTNALSLASALNIPLVTTFHGYDPTVAEFATSVGTGPSQKTAARFLCSSHCLRERLMQSGFPSDKLQVHHSGVDTQFFTADPKIERTPIILFVGPLVESSGCEILIRAMYQVEGVVPNAKLVVIGDGPLRLKLERFAQKFQRNIEFLGALEPESIRDWMNRAMVFCTPNMDADSGCGIGDSGMVYAAAQSMGLPVVGHASGVIPEIVGAEGAGLLVRAGDWEGLAVNMLGVLLIPEKWAHYSRAAEARARMLFDLRKQTTILEDIYQEVLKGSNPFAAMAPPAEASLIMQASA